MQDSTPTSPALANLSALVPAEANTTHPHIQNCTALVAVGLKAIAISSIMS